jgi:hypothetical protein
MSLFLEWDEPLYLGTPERLGIGGWWNDNRRSINGIITRNIFLTASSSTTNRASVARCRWYNCLSWDTPEQFACNKQKKIMCWEEALFCLSIHKEATIARGVTLFKELENKLSSIRVKESGTQIRGFLQHRKFKPRSIIMAERTNVILLNTIKLKRC